MNPVQDLIDLLGESSVSSDPADLAAHAGDWSARLLSWAHDTRTAVVAFGGGSSVVEGIAGGGHVVVDLTRLDRVSDIDLKARLVTVGSGVTGPQLRESLAAHGFMLGHEPQSHDISTVGGWVATRACGQLSARYGGIEDLVAGLEAVLPGGRVVRSKPAPRPRLARSSRPS